MDDHFTLAINSTMELLDNTVNPSLGNINSSNVSDPEFTPLSQSNFSDDYHQIRHDDSLKFIPLPDGSNDNPSFTFIGDHQAGSFYDPMANIPTTNDTLKRKSRDESLGNSNPPNFSSRVTWENKARRNYGYCGKKRKKNNEAKVEKLREVVHVRARRGEATDSHSLAERLRREKINGKFRSLQKLVPGCYKKMGMSVMLDVTINYIQSLQNQIEFLSMKLSAASMFYDFNSAEMEAFDSIKVTNGYEAQEMGRIGGERYVELLQLQSTWPL